MPDPNKVLTTLRRATVLSRATPGRVGAVVMVEKAEEVMVVGDLHGNTPAFLKTLEVAELGKNPGRHLVLQELVHGKRFYPNDGGDRSHQLVDAVAALKCQYPDRVHLILGNHELSELTGRPIAKGDVYLNELFAEGLKTAYGEKAEEITTAYHEFFKGLPLAVRTRNGVFLCHTIPNGHMLDRIDLEVLRTGVWPPESVVRGGTIYEMTWGRDTRPETVDRFAEMLGVSWFITGHQPCEEGFWQPNHRQIIIDGTDPYPTYCLFDAQGPVTIETLLAGVRRLPMPE